MTEHIEVGSAMLRVPDRMEGVEGDLAAISEGGYEVSPAVEGFLGEYGGSGAGDVVVIDPAVAMGLTDKGTVEEYGERVGEKLVPVAAAYDGQLVVLMDRRGRYFGGFDDHLAYAGDSAAEMFARVAGNDLEALPPL
jgi:hypothetical protein